MRPILALMIAVLAALNAPAARAQTVDEKLETMQRQIDELHRRLADKSRHADALRSKVEQLETRLEAERSESASRLADLAARLDERPSISELEVMINDVQEVAAGPRAPLASRSPLAVGGYFDFEYRHDQAKRNPTFDQHRFILKLTGTILEDAITFRSEIEIEGGGAGVSFLSDNEILVEYAELHFHFCDALNLKVGALLVPFGRFNYLHDSPLRDLTDRPLVARRVIPTTWTEAGIGFYGNVDIEDVVLIDYDIILSNGLDDDFSSTRGGGFRGSRSSFRADNNDSKMVIGRLGVSPAVPFLDLVNVGFSAGFGQYDDDDDQEITIWGLDWTLKKGPFELIGEYAQFNLERDAAAVAAGVPGGADGFYVQLNFHFFPESWRGTWKLFTEESTFTLVFRFGTIDTDDSVHGIDRGTRDEAFRDDLLRYTIGLNFRPIEKTVFKIEYQILDETGGLADADNNRFVMSFATYF